MFDAAAMFDQLPPGASVRAVFLGDSGVIPGVDALQEFYVRALAIISQTWAADRDCDGGGCPHGSPAREAGKQEFRDLMRGNMWIPTLFGFIYVLFVFCVPRFISKPLPVKPLLVLWNFALAVFSAMGTYHCAGALLSNVRQSPHQTACILALLPLRLLRLA